MFRTNDPFWSRQARERLMGRTQGVGAKVLETGSGWCVHGPHR
jgi:hypothetical protein